MSDRAITLRLLVETWAVLAALVAAAVWWRGTVPGLGASFLVGCWYQRVYFVGHEAVHRKLWPSAGVNDLLGYLLLTPIGVPLPVYRRIHRFHHAANRRDPETSALDVVVVEAPPGPLRRAWHTARWYAQFALGGHFVEGLVSIVALSALPARITRRLHPALRRWSAADRARSAAAFAMFVAIHVAVGWGGGVDVWAAALGWPLLAFAWVYSLITYIFHARATIGPSVHQNTRSLPTTPVISWWLLHFNEHATHHADPSIPWWQLRSRRVELPPEFAVNQDVDGFFSAIVAQLRGPMFVVRR